ncbi:MAG: zinc ribbon domain-containing protein [Clostridia bacterium]|nr:zinc ribbon domain-containing protein [Clostridia bacterium]
MYCGKCGKKNREGAIYCEQCGAKMIYPKKKFGAARYIIIGLLVLSIIVAVIIGIVAIASVNNNVYFSDDDYDRVATKDKKDNKKDKEDYDWGNGTGSSGGSGSGASGGSSNGTQKTQTDIEVDHFYYVDLPNEQAADELIKKDSEDQKGTTSNEIKQIENQIIRDYKVKAVNLGEMDVDTARGISNAFKYIYDNFPGARNMLSNISIGNMSISQNSVLAYFGPHEFAVSKSSATGYPKSVKTLMCLNSRYFLNPSLLQQAVEQSSKAGHFPKNVSKYAVVVHESGHFLTLVATMKKYGLDTVNFIDSSSVDKYIKVLQDWNSYEEPLSILNEAYENYKKKYNDNISFDEFRASISGYAMQTDKSGKPIYHETVAEAFHDYYTNGQNSAKASIEIVQVLMQRVNR